MKWIAIANELKVHMDLRSKFFIKFRAINKLNKRPKLVEGLKVNLSILYLLMCTFVCINNDWKFHNIN